MENEPAKRVSLTGISDTTDKLVSLNAASVKLPPFSRTEAQVWFRRAETQFRLRGISKTSTKADHVLASIPEDIFPQIAYWLNDQPDELSYEALKTYLLQEFTLKASERAQRVLALASHPLGDMSVRRAWNEMQALLTMPTSGSTKVDLEREILLQRLPGNIRAALPGAEDLPIDDLIKRADALIDSQKAAMRFQRPMVSDVEEDDVNVIGARRFGQEEFRRKQRGYLTASGVCNYHAKWGKAARACVDGCQWTKNGRSGR